MATVVTAVEDSTLRAACKRLLLAAGHVALEADRPLALLSLEKQVRWDALLLDDSTLGRQSLAVAAQSASGYRIIGLGVDLPGVTAVPLPLEPELLTGALASLLPPQSTAREAGLRLDPQGKRGLIGNAEIRLSDTEFRLLSLLHQRSPFTLATETALRTLWGQEDTENGAALLRVHIRNLRAKLAAAGLPGAIQSRRGQGYTLVL